MWAGLKLNAFYESLLSVKQALIKLESVKGVDEKELWILEDYLIGV